MLQRPIVAPHFILRSRRSIAGLRPIYSR